jgi:hypothetical protein
VLPAFDNYYVRPIMTTMQTILIWLFGLLSLKTILGFRFPWEICACCKKRMGDHMEIGDCLSAEEFRKLEKGDLPEVRAFHVSKCAVCRQLFEFRNQRDTRAR